MNCTSLLSLLLGLVFRTTVLLREASWGQLSFGYVLLLHFIHMFVNIGFVSSKECSVNHGIVQHTIQLEKYRTQLHILLGIAVQAIADSAVSCLLAFI